MVLRKRIAALWIAMAAVVATVAQGADEIPTYEPVPGISGNLVGVGSDTLNNMMAVWQEEFMKLYPNVTASYKGEGSSTAPPALMEGVLQLGPMSRAMKDEELDAFEKKFGYKPTELTVALDCLAVFVNKDNPIRGLTMPQVDCIFSSTRNSGFADVKVWGQAGPDMAKNDEWKNIPISLYGRNSVSGTYGFFKKVALLKGDFKDTVKEQPGSAAVINGVASDKGGVGYSGIGYKTADVRALPLVKDGDSDLAEPTFINAINGSYPLGRALYIYVNKKPNEPLQPLTAEFIKFVLSKQGQEVVVADGFGALPAKIAADEEKKVE